MIEELPNNKATVLTPWVPTPFAGTLLIVDRDQIEPLNAGMGEMTKVLGDWGFGFKDMLEYKV